MPWDSDIDCCVTYDDLVRLSETNGNHFYNQNKYLFEVNPNSVYRKTRNRSHRDRDEPNRIDARFIDKQTGLFLDITALHSIGNKRLSTKCPHIYNTEDLFPLRTTTLENVTVHVPANVDQVLKQEYGAKVVCQRIFKDFFFSLKFGCWLEINKYLDLESDNQIEEILGEISYLNRFRFNMNSDRLAKIANQLIDRTFRYHRIGYDCREISFLKNGLIGKGRASCEFFWDLKEQEDEVVLQISSKNTSHMFFKTDSCFCLERALDPI